MRDRFFDSTGAVCAVAVSTILLSHASDLLAAAPTQGPAAIDAGPVALTPTLGTEIKYRDNIYLQESNTVDSWIYLARPALNALLQDRNNTYQLDYKGEAAWYEVSSHNDRNDYFDNTFSGDAHLELSDRWIAEGYASWASLHEDRGTGLSEGFIGTVLPEPIEFDQSDVGGTLQFGTDESVGRLLVETGYMDRTYTNFKELTRPRDRDETTVATTFFYPVAPKTDVLAEYTFKNIHYPNRFEEVPMLDSDEQSLLVGAQWEINPNMTSTAKAGYVEKNFDDSARKDWDGLGWSLEVWMQPRDQDTILVLSTQHPEETTLQGNFIKREELSTTWRHEWSDRVYSELSGLIGQDTYEESFDGREDDIFKLSLKTGYEFRRWMNVYAGYGYDRRNSNADDLSYRDYIFNVGVELSL